MTRVWLTICFSLTVYLQQLVPWTIQQFFLSRYLVDIFTMLIFDMLKPLSSLVLLIYPFCQIYECPKVCPRESKCVSTSLKVPKGLTKSLSENVQEWATVQKSPVVCRRTHFWTTSVSKLVQECVQYCPRVRTIFSDKWQEETRLYH